MEITETDNNIKQITMKTQQIYILLMMTLLLWSGNLWAQEPNPSSYKPETGKKYVISGWVQEIQEGPVLSYNSTIKVSFTTSGGSEISEIEFLPSGKIIDQWQRIIGEFTVPEGAENIRIHLINRSDYIPPPPGDDTIITTDTAGLSRVYFDDIRVYPFNGNLKSFVYDARNQRLLAELDENNYATYYDYDKEGGLVRIKKETENGVYTIQETRSGNSKLNGSQ